MANNFVKKITYNAKCIEINRYISYTYKNVCLFVPNKFHSGQVIDISYIVDQFTTDYTLSAISLIDPDDVKKCCIYTFQEDMHLVYLATV